MRAVLAFSPLFALLAPSAGLSPPAFGRRRLLSAAGRWVPAAASAVLPRSALARERAQLELCLVVVLRVKYWAHGLAATLPSSRDSYLEARLGAKALLSGKIGGGASYNVIKFAPLKLRSCLEDAGAAKSDAFARERVRQVSSEIVEGLASLVEFDGMDTLTDDSPRSSLTLAQYSDAKGTFVRRVLLEKVEPGCDRFLLLFDGEVVAKCVGYVEKFYPEEVYF